MFIGGMVGLLGHGICAFRPNYSTYVGILYRFSTLPYLLERIATPQTDRDRYDEKEELSGQAEKKNEIFEKQTILQLFNCKMSSIHPAGRTSNNEKL